MEGGGTATEKKGRMGEEVWRVARGRDKKGGMKVEGMEVKLRLEGQKHQKSERKTRKENKGRMRGCFRAGVLVCY